MGVPTNHKPGFITSAVSSTHKILNMVIVTRNHGRRAGSTWGSILSQKCILESGYKKSEFSTPKASQSPSDSLTCLNGSEGLEKVRHSGHRPWLGPCSPENRQRILTSLGCDETPLIFC